MKLTEARLMTGDNKKESLVQLAVKSLRAVPEPRGELETLYRQHHELVFRAAHRVTGSAVDAEDVLQTVFLRLVKSQGSWDISQNPAAYLARAAINAALDLVRKRGRVVGLDDLNQEPRESGARNPEAQQGDRELQKLIRQAVSRLGATAAEMFVLRYYEGHDNREIARIMGTSQMVVGVVLHRARTKLRKEIGHYLEKHHEKQ
jgi:RNA polymerase sigma-70 factor (ECF subfamily)